MPRSPSRLCLIKLAAAAECDPRTVKKYLEGKPVRPPAIARAIEAAVEQHQRTIETSKPSETSHDR